MTSDQACDRYPPLGEVFAEGVKLPARDRVSQARTASVKRRSGVGSRWARYCWVTAHFQRLPAWCSISYRVRTAWWKKDEMGAAGIPFPRRVTRLLRLPDQADPW